MDITTYASNLGSTFPRFATKQTQRTSQPKFGAMFFDAWDGNAFNRQPIPPKKQTVTPFRIDKEMPPLTRNASNPQMEALRAIYDIYPWATSETDRLKLSGHDFLLYLYGLFLEKQDSELALETQKRQKELDSSLSTRIKKWFGKPGERLEPIAAPPLPNSDWPVSASFLEACTDFLDLDCLERYRHDIAKRRDELQWYIDGGKTLEEAQDYLFRCAYYPMGNFNSELKSHRILSLIQDLVAVQALKADSGDKKILSLPAPLVNLLDPDAARAVLVQVRDARRKRLEDEQAALLGQTFPVWDLQRDESDLTAKDILRVIEGKMPETGVMEPVPAGRIADGLKSVLLIQDEQAFLNLIEELVNKQLLERKWQNTKGYRTGDYSYTLALTPLAKEWLKS